MPIPRQLSMLVSSLALATLVAGCGDADDNAAGPAETPTRRIDVEMQDLAFSPTSIDVEAGETIRFVFTNTGKVDHEAYIGDPAAQRQHADEMADMADMEHDDDMRTVEPGDSVEMIHTFDEAGPVQVGCHQPGHFEAGMVMDIAVG